MDRTRRTLWLRAVAFLALLLTTLPALAHDLNLSGVRILQRTTDTVVSVSGHLSILAKEEHAETLTKDQIDQAVQRRLKLTIDQKPLEPTQTNVTLDPSADQFSWQTVLPGANHETSLDQRLYPEDPASRTLFTTFNNGVQTSETLLDSSTDQTKPSTKSKATQNKTQNNALGFLRQGIEHILSGPDHILFVIALLLLGGNLKSLIKTVTAFTLAHSLTLTLAVLGIVRPASRIIEPLIALSICAVAFENFRRTRKDPNDETKRDYRPHIAFAFGLIHGFGFAGALTELSLTGSTLFTALVSFNLGVEVGQAAIVLLCVPLFAYFAKLKPQLWQRTTLIGSATISCIGLFWFFTRIFAP